MLGEVGGWVGRVDVVVGGVGCGVRWCRLWWWVVKVVLLVVGCWLLGGWC